MSHGDRDKSLSFAGILRIELLSIDDVRESRAPGCRIRSSQVSEAIRFATGRPLIDRDLGWTDTELRYVLRMSARPTPFGLFAGVAQVKVGHGSPISLSHRREDEIRVRVDVAALQRIVDDAYADAAVSERLVRTNPTSHRVGDELRFMVGPTPRLALTPNTTYLRARRFR